MSVENRLRWYHRYRVDYFASDGISAPRWWLDNYAPGFLTRRRAIAFAAEQAAWMPGIPHRVTRIATNEVVALMEVDDNAREIPGGGPR